MSGAGGSACSLSDQMRRRATYALALGFGVLAGMRSASAPALLSAYAAARGRGVEPPAAGKVVRLLSSRAVVLGAGMMAAGEVVVDKLPITPARIAPLPLLGRVVSGAFVGLVVGRVGGQAVVPAAATGAAGAVVGAYGGYAARRALGRLPGLPALLPGVVEDLFVYGLGAVLLRALRRSDGSPAR